MNTTFLIFYPVICIPDKFQDYFWKSECTYIIRHWATIKYPGKDLYINNSHSRHTRKHLLEILSMAPTLFSFCWRNILSSAKWRGEKKFVQRENKFHCGRQRQGNEENDYIFQFDWLPWISEENLFSINYKSRWPSKLGLNQNFEFEMWK